MKLTVSSNAPCNQVTAVAKPFASCVGIPARTLATLATMPIAPIETSALNVVHAFWIFVTIVSHPAYSSRVATRKTNCRPVMAICPAALNWPDIRAVLIASKTGRTIDFSSVNLATMASTISLPVPEKYRNAPAAAVMPTTTKPIGETIAVITPAIKPNTVAIAPPIAAIPVIATDSTAAAPPSATRPASNPAPTAVHLAIVMISS